MKWDDVIAEVARRAELSPDQARRCLRAVTDLVNDRLASEESIRVVGLGTFRPRWRQGRVVRSVSDGRRVALDGRWLASFEPSNGLRLRLAARTPQYFREPAHQKAWRLAETLVGDLTLYHSAKLPSGLPDDPLAAEAMLLDTYDAAWRAARTRFEAEVPLEVREVRDHLLDAAQRRLKPL